MVCCFLCPRWQNLLLGGKKSSNEGYLGVLPKKKPKPEPEEKKFMFRGQEKSTGVPKSMWKMQWDFVSLYRECYGWDQCITNCSKKLFMYNSRQALVFHNCYKAPLSSTVEKVASKPLQANKKSLL